MLRWLVFDNVFCLKCTYIFSQRSNAKCPRLKFSVGLSRSPFNRFFWWRLSVKTPQDTRHHMDCTLTGGYYDVHSSKEHNDWRKGIVVPERVVTTRNVYIYVNIHTLKHTGKAHTITKGLFSIRLLKKSLTEHGQAAVGCWSLGIFSRKIWWRKNVIHGFYESAPIGASYPEPMKMQTFFWATHFNRPHKFT